MFRKADVQASGSTSVVHDQLIGRHHQAYKKWKVCRACKFCKIAVKSSLTIGRCTSYAMIVLQHKIKNDDNQRIGRSLDRESAVSSSFDRKTVMGQKREAL